MKRHQCLEQLAQVGVEISDDTVAHLDPYVRWLAEEAIPGGGLGPHEGVRLWSRHLCDSLAFAACVTAPTSAVDVGSGVGLPGIPLAILWPSTRWTLVDRSQRRVDLARRATRFLGLTNVDVRCQPASAVRERWPLVVARAAFPPPQSIAELVPLIESGGQAIVALNRGAHPAEVSWSPPADHHELQLEVKSIEVLDPPAWFLMIKPCE